MMAGWRAGGRCTAGPLGATAARRRIAVRLSRRARQRAGRGEDGVRAQVGWGVSGAAPRGSSAASGGSGAASPVLECLRARAGEGQRGSERKESERGVEREKKCQRFDLIQTQNFQWKLEKILNTKVVQNSISYNFPFRQNFV